MLVVDVRSVMNKVHLLKSINEIYTRAKTPKSDGTSCPHHIAVRVLHLGDSVRLG